MKFLSSLSVALMLGAATVAVAAAPSADAKKEKKSKAPKLKPSKAFVPVYQVGISKLEGGDAAALKAAGNAMKAAASTTDDSYLLGNFYLQAGNKVKDADMSIEGLDLLIASPLTNDDNRKIYHFQKGAQAFNGPRNYAMAAQSFEKAYEMGLRQGAVESNTANAYALLKDYVNSIKWSKIATEAKLSAGDAVPNTYYQLMASNATKSNDPMLLADTMQYILGKNPTSDYWHDSIVLFLRAQNLNAQDTLDLLRLMRETKTLRYPQQYSEYIEMANPLRYPVEVVSVLDEGFADGTIKKSEISFSESYKSASARSGGIRSTWDRDEREALASSKGYLALLTGDAMLSGGDYARASKMYETALSKGNVIDSSGQNQSDRAALRLGIAQTKLGNYDAAKAALGRVSNPIRKEVADFWTVFADNKSKPAVAPIAAPATAG